MASNASTAVVLVMLTSSCEALTFKVPLASDGKYLWKVFPKGPQVSVRAACGPGTVPRSDTLAAQSAVRNRPFLIRDGPKTTVTGAIVRGR
ncbi:hypothetical protein AHiyo4_22270 [Arthrobacter sp. Hiyo4]|nr:hypothetical protein AHiyo4_22270 [Arthrobacter sp. Hiyo4]